MVIAHGLFPVIQLPESQPIGYESHRPYLAAVSVSGKLESYPAALGVSRELRLVCQQDDGKPRRRASCCLGHIRTLVVEEARRRICHSCQHDAEFRQRHVFIFQQSKPQRTQERRPFPVTGIIFVIAGHGVHPEGSTQLRKRFQGIPALLHRAIHEVAGNRDEIRSELHRLPHPAAHRGSVLHKIYVEI